MKTHNLIERTVLITLLALCANVGFAENIDPYNDDNQYAYGENVGWLNFEPNVTDPNAGAQVSSENLTGFIWAENIGWISLSCQNTESCGTVNYGVDSDGEGNLSGYAWGENVGWINFDPNVPNDSNDYGVKIDPDGNFSGYAWGENIGWINFGIIDYYVVVCKVGLEDLARFAEDWLQNGTVPGNLNGEVDVDFKDYSILANYWLDYCPDNWQLKYSVKECRVNFEDLANFLDDWLQSGNVPGNLNDDKDVDFSDYSILASYWLDYCPDDWPLK